ncbi:MAG TPA: LamG domain-containing protein [Kofleriaceae bacterium]|nr:LamG domain-containing protein [Kofleriaceae bacterium]
MRLLCLVLVAGCYAPTYAPGGRCTTTCPGDLVCVDSVCVVPGTVVDHDAAVMIDAPGNVIMIDAPPPPPPIDAPPPDPTLIAHWKFDDNPANGTALDSTGNGHNGTCAGAQCPTLVTTGVDGGAYRFDPAVPQYLVVPDSTAFRGVFTIAMWMYTDNTTKQIAAMSKPVGTGTGNSWQLEDLTDDTVSFSGGSVHSLVSPAAVPQMTWAHIAGTWDGTTKRLYINGVMVASTASQITYDTHNIYLGADENNGTLALPFDGELDDLRVYNRVLSTSEIAALAQ